MEIFQAILLGIVEGITEFLPISSTGHLILASDLLNIKKTDFLSSFEISIQLGAILSVIVIYWRKIFDNKILFKTVSVAFLPAAVLGFILYKLIKTYLFGNLVIVLISLFVGGILLIIFEYFYQEKSTAIDAPEKITVKQAFIIGLFQCLAMVPGVSRAASTIIGGLIIGLKRKTIVEFSFLLAIPTMLAATCWDLLNTGMHFSANEWWLILTGFVVSFIVAWFSIKWLLRFIQNHSFVAFGIYRIAVAGLFWLMIL
jgi:undecaprenyl-diphosphatase